MSIDHYSGKTFVAFIDIVGFKALCADEDQAWMALDKFYQTGFNLLTSQGEEYPRVEGLFVSDCGILFVRNIEPFDQYSTYLLKLLKVVKSLNNEMLDMDIMLTTSIVFGDFKYEKRLELKGIGKNPFAGNAYLGAYADNSIGKPRIQPGECRIALNRYCNIEYDPIIKSMEHDMLNIPISKKQKDKSRYYCYWNLNSKYEIIQFEQKYSDSYNTKYAGMIKALKHNYLIGGER